LPLESRVGFHIGESSGEGDDGPNVTTSDERAPPQGSTTPWLWGTSDGGHGGTRGGQAHAWLQGGVSFTIAITSHFFRLALEF
jgi:hypothetical protein